mmetsp:Transcript_8429/g.15897  ORF Transcript_8429/g.15897 Transcript_8429/m.15897 type:complete len:349 (+) Transcript_8429:73-1119(+)
MVPPLTCAWARSLTTVSRKFFSTVQGEIASRVWGFGGRDLPAYVSQQRLQGLFDYTKIPKAGIHPALLAHEYPKRIHQCPSKDLHFSAAANKFARAVSTAQELPDRAFQEHDTPQRVLRKTKVGSARTGWLFVHTQGLSNSSRNRAKHEDERTTPELFSPTRSDVGRHRQPTWKMGSLPQGKTSYMQRNRGPERPGIGYSLIPASQISTCESVVKQVNWLLPHTEIIRKLRGLPAQATSDQVYSVLNQGEDQQFQGSRGANIARKMLLAMFKNEVRPLVVLHAFRWYQERGMVSDDGHYHLLMKTLGNKGYSALVEQLFAEMRSRQVKVDLNPSFFHILSLFAVKQSS